MHRIRFVILGIVSFVVSIFGALLAPGTFLNRALSAALCTVFSFNSAVCTASLVQSSERVVAATPPAVERSIADISGYLQAQRDPSEFGDEPSAPSPGSNPQAPPFPQDPGPNFPVRPEFDNPNVRQQTQSQSMNHPFTGLWLYSLHASPSEIKPFYYTFLRVRKNGDEYILSVCEENCVVQQIQYNQATHRPQEQALSTDDENLNFEVLPSTDYQAFWGRVLNRSTGEAIYFTMLQLAPLESSGNKNKHFLNYFSKKSIKIPDLLPMNSSILLSKNIFTRWFKKPPIVDLKDYSLIDRRPQDQMEVLDMTEREQLNRPVSRNPRPTDRVNPTDTFNRTGDDPGRQRGRQNQQERNQSPRSGNRLTNEIANSENTVEQAGSWRDWIKNNLAQWFDKFGKKILGSLFATLGTSLLSNQSNADNSANTNADESNMANNDNQDQPSSEANPEPSPEQKPIPQPSPKPSPGSASSNNGNTTSNNNNQQLPAPKPECSRTANTCLFSAEIYSSVEGRRLGRIGGFRAPCNASNNEVLGIIQREMTPYQRSALDGTLQIDQCVAENRPVVTSFTCNGGNSCTARWGSSPTLTFTYEDKDDNASSWQISGFTRGNPIAKGTISPPNGSGTINYNPKCDPNGYGSRDFPMSVTVTDASNLTSAPLSITLTCRS